MKVCSKTTVIDAEVQCSELDAALRGARTFSPVLAPQSVSLAVTVLFTPSGPLSFWACEGTLVHPSNAERKSPIVESSLRVIVVLLLPNVTSKVSITINQFATS